MLTTRGLRKVTGMPPCLSGAPVEFLMMLEIFYSALPFEADSAGPSLHPT